MFLTPKPPPYDPLAWSRLPFGERSRMVCESWALDGYGSPIAVYLLYAAKLAFYVAGWIFFCGFCPGAGGLADFATWSLTPVAFQKAVLWSMLFEISGFGCGSGPLTGRYIPPVGGFLYFLRVGTTRLPLFPRVPGLRGIRRTWLDVTLYAAHAGLLISALVAAQPTRLTFAALAILLPILGLRDKTLFLAARGEHYWTTIAIFALTADFVPGAKWVHAALWFWAGFAKLNHHFPHVVGVMTSNSPITQIARLRRAMYRDFPRDLAPSALAEYLGHAGTAIELAIPPLLVTSHSTTQTWLGLALMLTLHCFITSNVPAGVPLEWNVMMVYGGAFLFWQNADVSVLDLSLPVAVLAFAMCFAIPLLGNLCPDKVPFLLAIRYYAGNWAYSVWFFKTGSQTKLERLTKSSGWLYDQLGALYDHRTCVGIAGKVMAFRLMHLHGRVLPELIPRAIARFEDYTWMDGELMAGCVLGWNFGDGHLHGEQLLSAVQAQCTFAEGELRCIMVESQPLLRNTLRYKIVDAASGVVHAGQADVRRLRKIAPWGS